MSHAEQTVFYSHIKCRRLSIYIFRHNLRLHLTGPVGVLDVAGINKDGGGAPSVLELVWIIKALK